MKDLNRFVCFIPLLLFGIAFFVMIKNRADLNDKIQLLAGQTSASSVPGFQESAGSAHFYPQDSSFGATGDAPRVGGGGNGVCLGQGAAGVVRK